MWQNLKVVELASVLAGPLVGSFFAELGASVIKVENKLLGGDVTRSWKLSSEDPNSKVSAYYAAANFGKESIFLDFTNAADYQTVLDLVQSADIVIQNFKPGDDLKLKLEAKRLLKLNPKLIVGCINGFGKESTRQAFDVVLQAETGFMYMNGTPDSGPVKMPVALIDILAAHHLKEAILIALIERGQNGKGQILHISLYDVAIASLANQANNWLMNQHIPQAMGTQHPNIAPYGDLYKTKDDKLLVLAIGSDKHFKLLCETLEIALPIQKEFETNVARVNNREKLNQQISAKISRYSSEKISEVFFEKKLPFGIIKDLKEVFESPNAQKMILKSSINGAKCTTIKTLIR